MQPPTSVCFSYAPPASGYAVVPPASGYAVGPQLPYPAPPPPPFYPSVPAPQLPSYSLPSYRPYAAAPQIGGGGNYASPSLGGSFTPIGRDRYIGRFAGNQFTPIGGGAPKLPPAGPVVGGSYAPSLGGGSSYLPAPQGGSYNPPRAAQSTFQVRERFQSGRFSEL